MPTIRLETRIAAPIDSCFDLARNIDVHTRSAARTSERAVAGITTGLIGLNDTVTWEAVHFGIRQRLTVRVTEFDRPRMFTDEMVSGAFRSLRHVHQFIPADGGALMVDIFDYTSPCGLLGKLVDTLFLERYMTRFLIERNQHLKRLAEEQS